jgi:hypothetical protein
MNDESAVPAVTNAFERIKRIWFEGKKFRPTAEPCP